MAVLMMCIGVVSMPMFLLCMPVQMPVCGAGDDRNIMRMLVMIVMRVFVVVFHFRM